MKKILSALSIALVVLASCTSGYDDIALWNMSKDMNTRLTSLEELCEQMNSDIAALQAIVQAVKDKDYIESVAPISFNGKEIGYTITFTKGNPITIYHGTNGTNGVTPVIGVKKDSDGVYYWTVNGEWLTDNFGNKVKTQGKDGKDGKDGTNGKNGVDGKDGNDGLNGHDGLDGKDGKDGEDGKDGQDGITPQLKIEDGYWYVSVDNGETWAQLGKATGEDGKDGKDGKDGEDGKDGKDGADGVFQNIEYSEDGSYVVFNLIDGTTIKLPTWAAFEQLQTLCNEANANISALQTIVNAMQERDYIQSVTPLVEEGVEIGYIITFGTHDPITIYYGKDGKDGKDGTNGNDGKTPAISVKQDEDGTFYWTLNGEWLTDSEGNKVKAQGTDGKDGKDGKDGEDAIAPRLKIEEGFWYLSVDNGVTWEMLGKATGEDGKDGKDGKDAVADQFFQKVTYDNDYVYFTLSDGTSLVVAKGMKLSISFSQTTDIAIVPDKSVAISYTIENGGDNPLIKAISEGTLTASVKKETSSTGVITVSCPLDEPEIMEMIVYVSNGSQTCMEELTFVINEDSELLIPDSQFKNYLLKTCDMDADGTLTLKDARAYNAVSNINRSFTISTSVSNLDGIQYFDIDSLTCDYCNLTTLDVSKNLNLTTLHCSNNKISTLKLSPGITTLDCSNNQLTSLDVSNLPNLRELYCTNNKLESINLNHNIHLDALDCNNNSISRLSLSQNTELTSVNCNNNLLTWLDVKKNTKLNSLSCNYNKLQSLELGYANKELESLMCANNELTSLNVIYFPSLKTLNCANNKISALNLTQNTLLNRLLCQNNLLTTLDVSKTNLTGAIYTYPLYCKMSTLTTLILKKGWEIEGITNNRSESCIDSATTVEFTEE